MTGTMGAHQGVRHRGAVAGLVVVALGLTGTTVAAGPWRAPSGAHSPSPTIDPRLVIAPRILSVQARLSGDARLSGTLSPTIPGLNTLHLVVRDKTEAILRSVHLQLTTTMPGMSMVPISTTLVLQHDGYRGTLVLPMFGHYRAAVMVSTPNGRYTGTLALALVPTTFTTGR